MKPVGFAEKYYVYNTNAVIRREKITNFDFKF